MIRALKINYLELHRFCETNVAPSKLWLIKTIVCSGNSIIVWKLGNNKEATCENHIL